YGWTAQEAVGRDAAQLLYRPPAADRAAAQRTLLEKGEWSGDLRQLTKDGREVLVESRWTLLRGERGGARAKLVLGTDITERRRIETQLLRNQRMESIGTLAGGIAHDLNNILTAVLMSIDLLRMSVTDPQGLGLLDTLQASAQRGADLVKQV